MALKPTLAGLTDKQARFIQSYLTTGDVGTATQAAGYNHREQGYAALKSETIQKVLHDARTRMIGTEGATMALITLMDLLKPEQSGPVRLGAAKCIMTMAGHMDGAGGAKDRPIDQMSAAELQAMLGKIDGALVDLSNEARPVPTVVDAPSRGMDDPQPG